MHKIVEAVGYSLHKENGKAHDVLDNLGVVTCIRRIDAKILSLGKHPSREASIAHTAVFFELGMPSL